ncbi:mitochondrial inner-membrane-bound regulator-domain-containing protein [Hypoxylon sp. NC1633]|nr:mitochondrial inner-membrane-bound regulator-domain-containing protein [Hypoxylon sp. NC1633]
MIAKSVLGGGVCLRCRLRLLGPHNLVPSIKQQRLRCFASESTAPSSFSDYHPAPARQNRIHHDQKGYENIQTRQGIGIKEYVPGSRARKRHLSRNRILTEVAENLGSDMLGKPASVIVMRDGGLYRNKDRSLENLEDDTTNHQKTSIEALLDSQQKPPVAHEVRENVDSLRPKTETALSEREFRKLQALLTDGFLSYQLSDYLEHHRHHRPPHEPLQGKEDDQAPMYDWIKEITPWVPLGTHLSIAEGIDPSLHGYVPVSATVKERLAVRIMRECWSLSIAELNAGLGETRVSIRSYKFKLLMRGTQRWMTIMGNIWLEPGEKIEAFRKQNTLRLVTTKTKAASLIKDLDKTLKHITTKHIRTSLVAPNPINEAVLEEVGRITNTHVRSCQTSERLYVTWIELSKPDSDKHLATENLRDVVFRLLLTAFSPQPATTATFYAAGLDDGVTGRLILDTTSRQKLKWKDRMGHWARYILPLEAECVTSAVENPLRRLELPVEPQTMLPELKKNRESSTDTRHSTHSVKWAANTGISTIAHFGYLLHAKGLSSTHPLPDLLAANPSRVFAPVTPHPVHLAKFETNSSDPHHTFPQTKTTIVVRLWPSPTLESSPSIEGFVGENKKSRRRGASPGQVCHAQAPVIELRLVASGGEIKGVESLRAVKQTHITDVMLPTSAVDVRFTQTQYAALEGELATWQPLADFLGSAHLDLANGKLDLPSRQNFPIPRRLFSSSSTAPFGTDPDADQDEMVSYSFVGLELNRSVSILFEGFRLSYTSVNGGADAGQRAQVSLEPASETESSKVKVDVGNFHNSFLAACHRLAETNWIWSGYLAEGQSL